MVWLLFAGGVVGEAAAVRYTLPYWLVMAASAALGLGLGLAWPIRR
jgi:hypothetical protein